MALFPYTQRMDPGVQGPAAACPPPTHTCDGKRGVGWPRAWEEGLSVPCCPCCACCCCHHTSGSLVVTEESSSGSRGLPPELGRFATVDPPGLRRARCTPAIMASTCGCACMRVCVCMLCVRACVCVCVCMCVHVCLCMHERVCVWVWGGWSTHSAPPPPTRLHMHHSCTYAHTCTYTRTNAHTHVHPHLPACLQRLSVPMCIISIVRPKTPAQPSMHSWLLRDHVPHVVGCFACVCVRACVCTCVSVCVSMCMVIVCVRVCVCVRAVPRPPLHSMAHFITNNAAVYSSTDTGQGSELQLYVPNGKPHQPPSPVPRLQREGAAPCTACPAS